MLAWLPKPTSGRRPRRPSHHRPLRRLRRQWLEPPAAASMRRAAGQTRLSRRLAPQPSYCVKRRLAPIKCAVDPLTLVQLMGMPAPRNLRMPMAGITVACVRGHGHWCGLGGFFLKCFWWLRWALHFDGVNLGFGDARGWGVGAFCCKCSVPIKQDANDTGTHNANGNAYGSSELWRLFWLRGCAQKQKHFDVVWVGRFFLPTNLRTNKSFRGRKIRC